MSQLEVDKIVPQSGTTLTIGDSGDTINFADGQNISIDTNTLYIDSTNNYVGIGTASPSAVLHVDASGGAFMKLERTGQGHLYFSTDGTNGMIRTSSATGALRFQTNGNNERMRIDSSGKLLVGQTSDNYNATGIALKPNSLSHFTTDSNYSLLLNRKTNDGDIIRFYRDTTQVGKIGSSNSLLTIGSGDTGLKFSSGADSIFPFDVNTNSNRDNAVDFGYSTVRWKDLYLGGGLYVGGTGSANKLDDYEEGTWTPVYVGTTTDPVVTYQSTYGTYTKIGDTVYIQCNIGIASLTSVGSGDMQIGGLPFTVNSSYRSAITVGQNNDWGSNNHPSHAVALSNTTEIRLLKFPADPQDELINVTASGMLSGGNDNGVTFSGFYKV